MLSLGEQILHSTVRIECQNQNGSTSTGTGFFFRFKEEGTSYIPAIVTNKHVVKDSVIGKFYFTKADNQNQPIYSEHFPITISNFENSWIFHPDPTIDLCILPIAPVLQKASQQGLEPFFIALDKKIIPTSEQFDELRVIEDIMMVGYPNGIWDSKNNMPVVRKGITATNPALDYNGKSEFLIDAACFPGSSGSPVLIVNESGYTTKGGTTHLGGKRVLLMGVLYAGPQYTTHGEIRVVNIPTNFQQVVLSQIPNNLGFVIKSSMLMDFEELL